MACLCDKAAGCRFSQAEGEEVYRSLRADNGDRCSQARRHCLALSEESAIRLAERASDASRQYHRRGPRKVLDFVGRGGAAE